MFDLNDLIPPQAGWVLHTARGINDKEQIVGLGRCPSSAARGFLLTPIE